MFKSRATLVLQISKMICALLAAVITTVACEHFIRNDGMPIIYGGNNDTNMARSPGLLVVSPAPPQTQPLIPTVSANSAIQFVSPRDQQTNQQPRFVGPITHRVTNQLPHHAAPLEPATNPFPRFGETQGLSNQQFTAPREQITNSIQFPAPLVNSQPSNTQQITTHHPGLSFIPRPQVFHDLRQPTYVCDPLAKPLVDEVYDGKAYHFSWCHDGGRSYTWLTAVYYCAGLGNGFQPVSLESRREQDFISTIVIQHYISDVWTSGNTISSSSWTWLSGASSAYTNWSRTGRRGLPQPDNDEGNEQCLALLNNHYNDGVTWHDSNCNNQRHVICEATQFYGV
ncbi:uncharacterized protein [Cherax quadricarinatus]|uniref:uncharacterized protein isoform X1 n=2 Tax=Cherax quadricarinatus TaxID=27406 RepID=UPI00387E669F